MRGTIVVRPLMPEDASAAHDVLAHAFRGTPYLERLREVLDDALRFEDPEYLCLLAEPDGGRIGGPVT